MSLALNCGRRGIVATIVVLACTTTASANDRFWNQPLGGAFDIAEHWLPVGVPEPADTARFNLAADYDVGFSSDHSNLRLRVHQGHPTFNLNGHTYTISDASPGQFSVIVGTDDGLTGELTLAGGTLQASRSILGEVAGSAGIVNVGAGSSWNTAQLYVARAGDGTLNITGGATVTSTGTSILADQATAAGHVLVSGEGSTWQLQHFDVAAGGHATLQVLDGGTIRSSDAFMTSFLGSTAEVTVSGTGSEWEVADAFLWDRATVEITDGGAVTAGSASGRGTLTINSGGSLSIAGNFDIHAGGTIHFRSGFLNAGAASITGALLLDEGRDKVVDFNTLAVDHTGGGRVDLADNELLVREGSIADIHDLVKVGRADGSWNGDGITSSTAAADGQYAIGVGPAGDDAVRVVLTYGGDATLDGAVTIADLGILAANWQQPERHWFHGDFNYDGSVSIADLGILAANWQKGVGAAAGDELSLQEALGLFDVFDGVTIPEPALGLLGLAAAALPRRRRRPTQ